MLSPTLSGAYSGPRKPGPYAAGLMKRFGAMATQLGSGDSIEPSSFDKSDPMPGYWIGPVGL